MEHEECLERFEVTRLEQEAFELRVKVTLQSFVARGEDGDVVATDGVFECLKEESLLDELGEFCVTRVEESYEDRVGVDLTRPG